MSLDVLDDLILDDRVKGIPPFARVPFAAVGEQGWNLLRGDLTLPAAVIRRSALEHNSRWMQRFVATRNALIAPHVKTTMCPAIIKRQLADGAWGVTVATVQQMRVCRRLGANRVLLANQPVGRAELDGIVEEMARAPDLDFYALADSAEGVARAADAVRRRGLDRPLQLLVELGFQQGRTGCRSVDEALALARAIRARQPLVTLAGVEGFEGLLASAPGATGDAVAAFLDRMLALFAQCRDEGLFGVAPRC